MSKKRDVKILVDYLSFTVKIDDFLGKNKREDYDFRNLSSRIFKKFYLTGVEFEEKRGFYGYQHSFNHGGITVCHGGRNDIYIQLSGTGCRLFETLNTGLNWNVFLDLLKDTYYTLSVARLDIACDTFDFLSVVKMRKFVDEYRYVSRFRTYLVSYGSNEQSIYFGSTQSDFRLRIYNKTLERISKLDKDKHELVPENWVRLEFQLRNKAAESFLNTWLNLGDISDAYFGIMKNQLNFVVKRDNTSSRSEVVSWWRELLGNYSKIKLAYQGGLEYNIEKLNDYVFGQAGSSIHTWLELHDYDYDLMESIVKNKDFNEKQNTLISRRRNVTQKKIAGARSWSDVVLQIESGGKE